MVAFTKQERDALAKRLFEAVCERESYARKKDEGGQGKWVTIGGGPGPGGEQHAGGTPVKISKDGTIAAGPDNLEGKHIEQVDQDKGKSPPPPASAKPTEPPPSGLTQDLVERLQRLASLRVVSPETKAAIADVIGNQPKPTEPKPTAKPPESPTPIAPIVPPAKPVPGAPPTGGPNVSPEQHQQVKAGVGGGNAMVAYYHDGAYYFLHDDATRAASLLDGATAVTHDGLREALGKLTDAGHRVAVAEPTGQAAPRQKPQRKPKAEKPASPPPDTPPAPSVASKKPRLKPAAAQPASADAADVFRLKGKVVRPETPQGKQKALFDRFKSDDDSAKPLIQSHPTAAAIARGQGPHRLANQLGESPPPGVSVTNDGIWTGTATLHVADIQRDPTRFQYKVSGIGSKGVTKELADVKRFNPLFGGQLLVWRDPQNGQTFVINGHHRHELAERSEPFTDETTGLNWNGEMQAFYIPAKTAEQARSYGAMANMAEGRGTATDAAKFLRDSRQSLDDLKASGISLRGKVAADALHLKDLSPRLFQSLAEGRMTEGRALAVAQHLKDPTAQELLAGRIAKGEREGKQYSDAKVSELARMYDAASRAKTSGGSTGRGLGLFGEDDETDDYPVDEIADVRASLRSSLTSDRNVFRSVSIARRVNRIQATGGNVLDVEGNRDRAEQANEALFLFDRLADTRGELADAITAAAKELRHAPSKRREIVERTKTSMLGILEREWGKFTRPADTANPTDPEQYTALDAGRVYGNRPLGGPDAAGRNSRAHDGQPGEFRRKLALALRPVVERYAASAVETAPAKRSQLQANYRHGFPNAHCGGCAHFREGGRCAIVAGPISPDAVCDLFTRASSAAA